MKVRKKCGFLDTDNLRKAGKEEKAIEEGGAFT